MEPYEREQARGNYKRELADFLQLKKWHYFFTITNRKERKDSLAYLRDITNLLGPITRGRVFLAIERARPGLGVHAHGLLHTNSVEPLWPAKALWAELFHRFGRSTVEIVGSQKAVATYCAKYVAKAPDFDYSFLGDRAAWKW